MKTPNFYQGPYALAIDPRQLQIKMKSTQQLVALVPLPIDKDEPIHRGVATAQLLANAPEAYDTLSIVFNWLNEPAEIPKDVIIGMVRHTLTMSGGRE
jgi:hypothetical protein